MTKRSTAGLAAAAMLLGTLACAGGMGREDDTAAAQDTTEVQNPPGYRGRLGDQPTGQGQSRGGTTERKSRQVQSHERYSWQRAKK